MISTYIMMVLLIISFKFFPSSNKFFCILASWLFLVLSWFTMFEISFFLDAELFLLIWWPIINKLIKKVSVNADVISTVNAFSRHGLQLTRNSVGTWLISLVVKTLYKSPHTISIFLYSWNEIALYSIVLWFYSF